MRLLLVNRSGERPFVTAGGFAKAMLVVLLGAILTTLFLTVEGSRYWVIMVAMLGGALALADGLFTSKPPASKYARPVGQMVIATIVNLLLTLVLFAFAFVVIGTAQRMLEMPMGKVSDTDMLAMAILVAAIQGIAYPLSVWWRWFGERHFDKG